MDPLEEKWCDNVRGVAKQLGVKVHRVLGPGGGRQLREARYQAIRSTLMDSPIANLNDQITQLAAVSGFCKHTIRAALRSETAFHSSATLEEADKTAVRVACLTGVAERGLLERSRVAPAPLARAIRSAVLALECPHTSILKIGRYCSMDHTTIMAQLIKLCDRGWRLRQYGSREAPELTVAALEAIARAARKGGEHYPIRGDAPRVRNDDQHERVEASDEWHPEDHGRADIQR